MGARESVSRRRDESIPLLSNVAEEEKEKEKEIEEESDSEEEEVKAESEKKNKGFHFGTGPSTCSEAVFCLAHSLTTLVHILL